MFEGSGEPANRTITVWAHIDEDATGLLNNTVVATGWPPYGDNVTSTDYAHITALNPNLMAIKTGFPKYGTTSTVVTYTLDIVNLGDCVLDPVEVRDVLPTGMTYVNASPLPDEILGNVLVWTTLGPLMFEGSGEPANRTITVWAHIDEDATGLLNNTVVATGWPPHGNNITRKDYDLLIVDREPPVTIKEYGSPNLPAQRGAEIIHYITSDTLIYINASDQYVGVSETWYQIFDPNGTLYTVPDPARDNYTLYTGPFTLDGPEGMYIILYKSIDHLGNMERLHKQRAILDNTPPLGP
jgi:uncharacterized repeat protein (TIGR01451 family)